MVVCALRSQILYSSLTFCIACTDGFERCTQGCNPGITEKVGQLKSICRARARQKYDETECRKCPTLAKRLLYIVHDFCPPRTSPFSPLLHPFALSLLLFTSRTNGRYQYFHLSVISLTLSVSHSLDSFSFNVCLSRSFVVSLSLSC